jgi:UDPglucose 6-dehydrogenase
MNLTVIGTGYVGLVTGACLADLGNHVFCLDIEKAKIDLLNPDPISIYEPGVKRGYGTQRQAFRLTSP